MTNIDLYPIQDNYESKLSQPYNGTDSVIYVDNIPTATLPSGQKVIFTINPGTSFAQSVEVDGWTTGQLSVSSTTVKKGNGFNYSTTSHGAKSPIIISDNFVNWEEIAIAVNSKSDIASPVFTGSVGLPTYADATARDTAIPSPTQAMIVQTNNVVQHYNSGTAQREDLDVGTPPPNASDTEKGLVQMSTPAQITAGTSVGETGARLVVGPAELKTVTDELQQDIIDGSTPSALYEKGLIAGEDIDTNESVFPEKGPTYAEATLTENIGDITANTRVATRQISKGGSLTDFDIAVDKVGSPSTDLIIDLYEDDLTGSPIGTATIPNASITGSKADLTVSRDSAFTFPTAGTVIYYVGRQTSDTVNGSNYFRIYYQDRHTTTRPMSVYDGSVWTVDNGKFVYITSDNIQNTLLSLTSASYTYKLPTDYPRIANQDYTAGEEVTSIYFGLADYPGLVDDTVYFVGNVPGGISAVAGTNESIIGLYNNTKLFVGYDIDTVVAGTTYVSGASDSVALLNFTPTAVWTKLKEIEIGINGSYTTEFEVQTNVSGNDSRAAVFKNGVQIGISRLGGALGTWVGPYSENFTFVKGDLIQIYAQKTSSGSTGVRNFRIKYSRVPAIKDIYNSNVVL